MDNMLAKRYSVLACAILVSACSGTDTRRQANQEFDYLEQQQKADLVIVDGLDTPLYTQRYAIPKLSEGAENRPVGAAVDVRSPVQILALSPLVRVEEGSDNVTVWFNSQSAQDDVTEQVWTLLANFLADKKVAIAKLDKENRTLETDWLINRETFEQYREITDYELRQRYKFSLLTAVSKRSVGLQVDLIEHEERLDGLKRKVELTSADDHRYAVQMLNLVNIYSEAERIKSIAQVKQEKQTAQLKIAFVDSEHPVITLNIPFDDAWKVLPDVLGKIGISVEDEDKIAATLLVSYSKPVAGYWAGHKLTPVVLEEDDYRVQLGEVKGHTSLAFFSEDKQPLSAEEMS
ncbi:MAG: outer membrane protein assembly factor BamC, partial [Moritella sp.]